MHADLIQDWDRLNSYIEEADQAGLTRLPPEPKLSAALGISRGRLRTLLKKGEADGVIWRHVGRGTFIGSRQDVLTTREGGHSVSVGDVMDARVVLEPQLAGQAAVHATAADLVGLDQCLQGMDAAASYSEWKRFDARLHRTIAQASHNTLLVLLYDTLRTNVTEGLDARMAQVFGAHGHPKTGADAQHHQIVDAIRCHDPQRAEALMRDHLADVRREIFGLR